MKTTTEIHNGQKHTHKRKYSDYRKHIPNWYISNSFFHLRLIKKKWEAVKVREPEVWMPVLDNSFQL